MNTNLKCAIKYLQCFNDKDFKKIIENMKVSMPRSKKALKTFKTQNRDKQIEDIVSVSEFYNDFFKTMFKIYKIKKENYKENKVQELIENVNENNYIIYLGILFGIYLNNQQFKNAIENNVFEKILNTKKDKSVIESEKTNELKKINNMTKENNELKLLAEKQINEINNYRKQVKDLKKDIKNLKTELNKASICKTKIEILKKENEETLTSIKSLKSDKDKKNKILDLIEKDNLKLQIDNKRLIDLCNTYKNQLKISENLFDNYFVEKMKRYIIIVDDGIGLIQKFYQEAYVVNEQKAKELFEKLSYNEWKNIECIFCERRIIGLDEKALLINKYNINNFYYVCEAGTKRIIMEIGKQIIVKGLGEHYGISR